MKAYFLNLIFCVVTVSCIGQVKSNDVVGIGIVDDIQHRSIYTSSPLTDVVTVFQRKLSMESTKAPCILLFYNHIGATPNSDEIIDEKKRFNDSLIGGLEISQGIYYMLIYEKGKGLIRGNEIIPTMPNRVNDSD